MFSSKTHYKLSLHFTISVVLSRKLFVLKSMWFSIFNIEWLFSSSFNYAMKLLSVHYPQRLFFYQAKIWYITIKGASLIVQGVSKRISKVYSQTSHMKNRVTSN